MAEMRRVQRCCRCRIWTLRNQQRRPAASGQRRLAVATRSCAGATPWLFTASRLRRGAERVRVSVSAVANG